MKKKDLDFFQYFVAFVTVCSIAYGLAVISSNELTFVVTYSVVISIVSILIIIYFIPVIRLKLHPEVELNVNPGMALLRGKDGSRLTPKKKDLQERLRRNRI